MTTRPEPWFAADFVQQYAEVISDNCDLCAGRSSPCRQHWIQARAMLSKLATDGRLFPPGGETAEGWGLRWPDGYVKSNFTGRTAAETYKACDMDGVELVRRTITWYADGSSLTSAWELAGPPGIS